MTTQQQSLATFSPEFRIAVELIGKRWTGVILRSMLGGATHFSDFTSAIPGLSDRLVSLRLKELETEGVIERIVIPDKPVKIEYVLTEKGRTLLPVFDAIQSWADRWV